jgi:glycosyltransferase involved in cell wall biosynthesis
MRPLTIFVSHCSDLFTDNRPHGDGLVAYEFVSRLAERGHRLHVATLEVDLKKPLHPNATLHPIHLRMTDPILQRVEYALRVRGLLQRLRRTERFDLIHQLNPVWVGMSLGLTGMGLPIVLGSYAARWLENPDGIVSSHAWMDRLLGAVRDRVAAEQQGRASAILLTTPAAENQLSHREKLKDRLHILPYGLDTDRYSPAGDWNDATRLAGQRAHPTILFLASLNRRKGIFELLEAFAAVGAEFPECRLRIVGAGAQMDAAKLAARRSPMAAQIEFLPPQPRAATIGLYRECTIFCSPSLGEPFGMAPIEAMACGCPMVATAAGGQSFTVRPEGGVLTPIGDSGALAAGLLRLLRNPEERQRMALFNRRWAREQFSWETLIPRLEAIYGSVL